jgi:excisionase family DNA binding protein
VERNGDQLLTVPEVAGYLRIGPESTRRWLREGKLRGINLGRGSGWRIRRADLEFFIAQRDTAPTHGATKLAWRPKESAEGEDPTSTGFADPIRLPTRQSG